MNEKRNIKRRGKFTHDQAIVICQRKIPTLMKRDDLPLTCRDCYYYDDRCEITGEKDSEIKLCMHYSPDPFTTNMVRWKILNDEDWCLKNWESLCWVDKELYKAVYDCDVVIVK